MKWIKLAVLSAAVVSGCAQDPDPSAGFVDESVGLGGAMIGDTALPRKPDARAEVAAPSRHAVGVARRMASSGPAISSWGQGRLDIFVRGADDALWHRSSVARPGVAGRAGRQARSDPAAVSWGGNHIDVFIRSSTGSLQQLTYHEGTWDKWKDLGGTLTSAPAVASWGPGRLDVFVRTTANALHHRTFETGWSDWKNLNTTISSDPAAVSWGPGRIDVIARVTGTAWSHRSYDAGKWSTWTNLGKPHLVAGDLLVGSPADWTCSRGAMTTRSGTARSQTTSGAPRRAWAGRSVPPPMPCRGVRTRSTSS